MLRLIGGVIAGIMAIWIFTDLRNGTGYAVNIKDAQRILAATMPPAFVFGSEAPSFRTTVAPGQITWVAQRGGSELFRYTATLSEIGKGKTGVKVQLLPSEAGGSDSVAKRLSANPAARGMYLAAMQEQIAATLEKRKFDMSVVMPALMGAALANMSKMQKSADEAAKVQIGQR